MAGQKGYYPVWIMQSTFLEKIWQHILLLVLRGLLCGMCVCGFFNIIHKAMLVGILYVAMAKTGYYHIRGTPVTSGLYINVKPLLGGDALMRRRKKKTDPTQLQLSTCLS